MNVKVVDIKLEEKNARSKGLKKSTKMKRKY